MSGLSLLDVAIAMVFFFLLLSLICSAANEIFAAFLQTRARFLERGIRRLLVDQDFADKLFNHALIKTLADEVDKVFFWHKPLPSYIPSKTFALALMDLVNLGGSEVRIADNAAVPASVRIGLNAMLNDAGQDATKVRQTVEEWYNTAMDRVSGVYKRRVQYVLFTLGFIVAIVMNADSVAVIKRLAASKALSTAVEHAADTFQGTQVPSNANAAEKSLQDTLATLDRLELPIGWTDAPLNIGNPKSLWDSIKLHWIGWLVTGLAVSFGAPFWFDVLSRFVTVRSTIKPVKEPEEDPKKNTPK